MNMSFYGHVEKRVNQACKGLNPNLSELRYKHLDLEGIRHCTQDFESVLAGVSGGHQSTE